MSSNPPSWYIPGEGQKPAGPFTAEQIIESWRAGGISEKTMCWQEGMPQWLPLIRVEPFGSTIRAAHRAKRRTLVRRVTTVLVGAVFLSIVGVVVCVYWNEATTIHKAKTLIAAGRCDEAAALLRTFRGETYLYGKESRYLFALATFRQYALATDARELSGEPLKKPKKQLKELFQDGERWRERAKSELADIIDKIPEQAPDDLARAVALANVLRELKLAEDKPLAKQLLGRLKARADAGRDLEDAAPAVAKILDLDPPSADYVLSIMLGGAGVPLSELEHGLAIAQRWVRQSPAIAKLLADAMFTRADNMSKIGRRQTANALLDAAEKVFPRNHDKFAKKRLAWLKNQLDDKDYAGVVRRLDAMSLDRDSAVVVSEAASLYLQAAQGLSKTYRTAAARALERAFQLEPGLADSETNAILWLRLHPEPSDDKLRRCKEFLAAFPDSTRCNEVRNSMLVGADRLAETGRPDEAIATAEWLLKECPKTPKKQEINDKIVEWKAMPPSGPKVEPPRPPGQSENVEKTLEEELTSRRVIINTPSAIKAAVANKDVWIIQVADTCTADKFDSHHTELLRNWVSNGGILWANNNVLALFGVRHQRYGTLFWSPHCKCTVSGGASACPILAGCKKVSLKNVEGRAHTLSYEDGDVIPLLALVEDRERAGLIQEDVGITVWSLVSYGSGWITDPKDVDVTEYDGACFQDNFYRFCLRREIPGVSDGNCKWSPPNGPPEYVGWKPPPGGVVLPIVPGLKPEPHKGPLSGTWQASTGAQLFFEDDGKDVTVKLIQGTSDTLQQLTGKLTRRGGKADAKQFDGRLHVTLIGDTKARHTNVIGTLVDENTLRLRCANWPVITGNRWIGGRNESFVFTRKGAVKARYPDDPFRK